MYKYTVNGEEKIYYSEDASLTEFTEGEGEGAVTHPLTPCDTQKLDENGKPGSEADG